MTNKDTIKGIPIIRNNIIIFFKLDKLSNLNTKYKEYIVIIIYK